MLFGEDMELLLDMPLSSLYILLAAVEEVHRDRT